MIKMFCITYAGGSANFFRGFSHHINQYIECIAIEYKGRGKRKTEPFSQTIEDLIEDIAVQINQELSILDECIIFGYSMGSLIAYEIAARNLLRIQPLYLIVAAHLPPDHRSIYESYSSMSDQELIDYIITFGGLDMRLYKDKRFWPLILPQIRNDYRLLENYTFNNLKKTLDIDISVLYSDSDTPFKFMEKWSNFTTGNVIFHSFRGNHFFLKGNEEVIISLLLKDIEKSLISY